MNPNLEKRERRKLIPLILIIAIIPFLVYEIKYYPHLSEGLGYELSTDSYDYFLAIKQYALFLCGAIMLVILAIDKVKNQKKFIYAKTLVPLMVYVFFTFLSEMTAINKKFAFLGGFAQFQGFLAIVVYIISIFYAIQYIHSLEDVKYMIKMLSVSVIIMIALGVLQFLGYDFLNTSFYRHIITPISEWHNLAQLSRNNLGSSVILTLYNPNYVGSYIALMLPLSIVSIYIGVSKKEIIKYIVIAAGLAICLIGSGSATGFIAAIAEAVFLIVLLRKQLIKRWYFTASVVVVGVIGCLLPYTRQKIDAVLDHTDHVKQDYNLTNITTNDQNVGITYKGNTVYINQFLDGEMFYGYTICDEFNGAIDYTYDEETFTYTITDERFAGIQVMPLILSDVFTMKVTIDGKEWIFTNQLGNKDTYYYYNHGYCYDKIVPAKSIGFRGKESFASGRGYIWSRTLPLIKDHIFLGCGSDNFIFAFPAKDYVMSENAGFGGQILTKPHSMYLQIAIESGVVSLIAFLVFYIMYFISSIRLYLKSVDHHELKKYGVGIFIGTIGYMVAGLANDSMICVAPIFWAFIGIGIAINRIIRNEQKEMTEE